MLQLPVDGVPLNVALVFNVKKEETTTDESIDPPSPNAAHLAQTELTLPRFSPRNDTFAEWDTMETIEAVRAALAERHKVTLIEADRDAYNRLSSLRPDIVFNIAEGLYGVSREAQLPAMLEYLGIPYTGSDPLTLALCLDKARAKEILSYYNIPTPRFASVSSPTDLTGLSIQFPNIVKPLHEGSSKGIYNSSVVQTWDELWREVNTIIKTYNEPALVEQYIDGREFTVAMLGNGNDVQILPIVEIKFDSLPDNVNPIYSFEAKWIWDRAESPLDIFQCPADISHGLQDEIDTLCRKAYAILRCRDWCRIDVRLDGAGRPHVLELNPLPGILPKPEDNSCFPKAARAAGMSYNQLIQTVLHVAAVRTGLLNGTN